MTSYQPSVPPDWRARGKKILSAGAIAIAVLLLLVLGSPPAQRWFLELFAVIPADLEERISRIEERLDALEEDDK